VARARAPVRVVLNVTRWDRATAGGYMTVWQGGDKLQRIESELRPRASGGETW